MKFSGVIATMFDFFEQLEPNDKIRYNRMLETQYVLVRSDEYHFLEENELGEQVHSCTWLHSIKPVLDKYVDLDPNSYPQGSLTSNNLYLSAIETFLQHFPSELVEFRRSYGPVRQFLKLRRDDSGDNSSYLFGSRFQLMDAMSAKSKRRIRVVEVSARHAASGMAMVAKVHGSPRSDDVKRSILALCSLCHSYLQEGLAWSKDPIKHLTLASLIGAFRDCLSLNLPEIDEPVQECKEACEARLLQACIEVDIDGAHFRVDEARRDSWLHQCEYYLTCGTLRHVIHLLDDERLQAVVKTVLNDASPSENGMAVPLCRREKSIVDERDKADFGVSISILSTLYRCIEQGIGETSWQEECKAKFTPILRYCLSAYDSPENYRLVVNENIAQALHLPYKRQSTDLALRVREISDYVRATQSAIHRCVIGEKINLDKELRQISAPSGLEHVPRLLAKWDIPRHRSNPRHWQLVDVVNSPTAQGIANLVGNVAGPVLKSMSS